MMSAWKLRCSDGGFDLHPDGDREFQHRLLRIIANDGQEESEEFYHIVKLIVAAPHLANFVRKLAKPDVLAALPDELRTELLHVIQRVSSGFKPFLEGGAREQE